MQSEKMSILNLFMLGREAKWHQVINFDTWRVWPRDVMIILIRPPQGTTFVFLLKQIAIKEVDCAIILVYFFHIKHLKIWQKIHPLCPLHVFVWHVQAILHDWNDERCLRLLNNCWEALPSAGGKLILLDHIMPLQTSQEATDPEGQQVFTTDFMMQLHCASGRERSATELERLLKQARFTNFQVITDVGPCYVMEAFKWTSR